MGNNELLLAISEMMDQKLEPIISDVQDLKGDVQDLKGDVQVLKDDVQNLKDDVQVLRNGQAQMKEELERQIGHTERSLKAEIVESENLILEEVSRVHRFLIAHIQDRSVHTA